MQATLQHGVHRDQTVGAPPALGFDKQTVITGDAARGQRLTISVGADGARRDGDAAATGIKQVISRGGGPFAIANHYVRRVDAEQTFTQQYERVIAIQSRDIVNRHHQRA